VKIAFWAKLEPRAEDWRNVLSEYDAVVYEIGRGPIPGPLREALVAWPGIIVLHGTGLDDVSTLALDRAVAVVVDAPDVAERIRVEHPWTEVVLADEARDIETFASARSVARHRIESVLEAAAAEIPGFFPGDRSSPWRAEVEELVTLRQTGANVSQRTTRSPR